MQFLKELIPADRWKLPVILIAGIFTGLGIFSFHISNAPAYLGDKPETCVNCHIRRLRVLSSQPGRFPHILRTEICKAVHFGHVGDFKTI